MSTSETRATEPRPTNELGREKSPYLLQHQHNPVAWRAWSDAAFAQARGESKLVFLSIGYSTCHWCHVMERESFEDPMVARFLNEHFVSIKVDREERPDVDRIYMTFVQATTGQGGWPLNVFLTPDGKPIFGGTYFPPDPRHGRPSFLQVIEQLQHLWATRREEVLQSAVQIHKRLQTALRAASQASGGPLSAEEIRRAGAALKESYDRRHGGFGSAPKFPQPSQPQLLLRYAQRFEDAEASRMVLDTCDRMAAGGIHDQLGGGFARYSVDAEWLVPHFEKMLYDNAQLVHLYLDAFLISGEARHADVARGILDYVRRDLTHSEGGFFSAEDADSEGHEGKFYCWTLKELSGLLSSEEYNVAVRYYGLTERGNFVDHSHPSPLPNQNVLHIANPELDERDRSLLASAKAKMVATRARRIRPHLDDKVLCSWNGLMLGAFARAYAVLEDEAYRVCAERNLAFLQSRLWEPAGRTLYHRWREGEHDQVQLGASYAFLLAGVLELYEATLIPTYLEFAVALARALLSRFHDPEQGGFWQSAPAKELILRMKEDYDGAEPSAGSVACLALLKLGHITGQTEFTAAAQSGLGLSAERLRQVPQAVPYLLQALDFSLDEPLRAVVTGTPGEPETQALIHVLHQAYLPNKIVLGRDGPVEPFARDLPAGARPLVYVCSGTACQRPMDDPRQVREALRHQRG